MLILNKNILTIGGNRLEGGPLTPPTPPTPSDEVTIGTQTWKSVNLAVDDGQGGITVVNNVTANGVNFGTQYYYTWAAAVRVASSISGWHLPSKAEFETLQTYAGGSSVAGGKLKSTSGWNSGLNGTDDYSFNGIPVGYIDSSESSVPDEFFGSRSAFWTSTTYSSSKSYRCYFSTGTSMYINNFANTSLFSVRLVKDT